jgi:hypothetical protein
MEKNLERMEIAQTKVDDLRLKIKWFYNKI